jgi:hypothetical protein
MKMVLDMPFDFTPAGKRRVQIVAHNRGRVHRIRWYVSGRRYHVLPVSAENLALSRDWAANAGAADNRPQPWENFE